MARPAQYSRGRRVVMQITLFGVFLATLGLAALLAETRLRAASVELSDKPLLWDSLSVKVPKGWRPEMSRDGSTLQLTEPGKGKGHDPRVIVIQQIAAPGVNADRLFQQQFHADGHQSETQAFPIFDQPGYVAEFAYIEQATGEVMPTWVAAGVVKQGSVDGSDLGIVLEVRGETVSGPAGLRLLRQIADGLSLQPKRSEDAKS